MSVWCVTYSWLCVCSQIAMCSTLVPGRCWNLWFWFKRQLYPLLWVLSLSLFLFMLLFYLNNVLLSFTWMLAMTASALSLGIKCSKISSRKTISICKPSPSQFQPKWAAIPHPPHHTPMTVEPKATWAQELGRAESIPSIVAYVSISDALPIVSSRNAIKIKYMRPKWSLIAMDLQSPVGP